MDSQPPETDVRFAANKLHFNRNTSFRHFIPVVQGQEPNAIQRDRFGNRIFTSSQNLPENPTPEDVAAYEKSNRAYRDREGNDTRAALLVSPTGEQFIRANLAILNDIEFGLTTITESHKPGGKPINAIDLGNGRMIKKMNKRGAQSELYLLDVNAEQYVIKVKNERGTTIKDHEDPSQPYINEMLQAQAVTVDLHETLDAAGIAMPDFLFASGQVSCTKFVEGDEPTEGELVDRLDRVIPAIERYIREQNSGLWKNVYHDTMGISPRATDVYWKTDNFIQKRDGTMVWVDPFLYHFPRSESRRAQKQVAGKRTISPPGR